MSSIASPRSSTSSQSTSTNTNSNLRGSASLNHPAALSLGSNLGAGVSLLNFHDNATLGGGERLLSSGRSKAGKESRMGLGGGFNAISTVLNNPTRPQPPIDPSSSRYPPLAPNHVNAELPVVKRSDHSAYIDSVGSEWARWVGSVRQGREGRVNLDKESSEGGKEREEEDQEERQERKAMATRKRLAPLSAVPQVFFSEDFSLGNPYTFDLVTERYKSTASTGDDDLVDPTEIRSPINSTSSSSNEAPSNLTGYDPALNLMLLEKLSYYSDVLEQHLTLEISARSSSFFNALSNLQDLSSSTTACLQSIESLQKELSEMKGKSARHAKAVKYGEERRIWEERERGVRIIREICRAVEVVGILAEAGEREEALRVRDQVLKALEPRNRSSPSRPSLQSRKSSQQMGNGNPSSASSPRGLGTPIHLQGEFGSQPGTTASEDEYDDPSNPSPSSPARRKFQNNSDPSDPGSSSANPQSVAVNGRSENRVSSIFGEAELDLDLSQIPSLMSLKPQLHNLSSAISQQVEEELLGVLRSDLVSQSPKEELSERVEGLMRLLVRTSAVERTCGQGWRELALGSVKEVLRSGARSRAEAAGGENGENGEDEEESKKALRDLPSLLEDESFTSLVGNIDGPSSSTGKNQASTAAATAALAAAQYVKSLKQEIFLEILISLFAGMMVCLNSIKRQNNVLLQVLNGIGREEHRSSTINGSHPTSPNQSQSQPQSQSQELTLLMPSGVSPSLPQLLMTTLHLSTDLSHQLFSRLLSLRSSIHSSLTLNAFLETFRPTWEFILTSESLSNRTVTGLRGQVLNQAKSWLIEFHKRNIEDASRKVEEERWDQKDVDWRSQANVALIIDAATNDPDELVISSIEPPSTSDTSNGASQEKESSKTLRIEQGSYAVVQASLDTLNLLIEYLKVVINLPMMSTETMGRTVEFLKTFNSRTCQVVLGAGAMRSAGLKNITAKHLALASQSLSIMISLIPYVRETIRRHLTATQAVMLTEFDKLRRDYQEHQYEIHAKLVAIMSDRLTVHCRNLAGVAWSAPLPSSPPETNKYAIDLVKETATLHKVLSKYLQAAVVGGVMGQVLDSIDRRVAAEFEKIEVKGKEERERMVADKEYIEMKMKGLKSVEWKGKALEEVLERKPIPVSKTPAASSSPPLPPAPEKKSLERNSLDKPSSPAPTPAPAPQPQPQTQHHTYIPRIPSLNPFARRNQTLPPQDPSSTASPTSAPATSQTGSTTDAVPPLEDASSSKRGSTDSISTKEKVAVESPVQGKEELPPVPSKDSPKSTAEGLPSKGDATEVPESTSAGEPAEEAQGKEKVVDEEGKSSQDVVASTPADAAASTEDREAVSTDDGPAISEDQKASPVPESKEQTHPEADNGKTEAAATDGTTKSDPTGDDSTRTDSRPSLNEQSAPALQLDTTAGSASASPAQSSPETTSTPTATPTKPARMSLQQRLAEAARKRGAQQAQAQGQAQNQTSSHNAGSNANSNSSSPQTTPLSTNVSLPSLPAQVENEIAEPAASQDQSRSQEEAVSPVQTSTLEVEDNRSLVADNQEPEQKKVAEKVETTTDKPSDIQAEQPSSFTSDATPADLPQPATATSQDTRDHQSPSSTPQPDTPGIPRAEVDQSEAELGQEQVEELEVKEDETQKEQQGEEKINDTEVEEVKQDRPAQSAKGTEKEGEDPSPSGSASASVVGDDDDQQDEKDVSEGPAANANDGGKPKNGGGSGAAGKKKKKKGKKGKK